VVDHVGRVVEWNPAAERSFGRARAEVLGEELADLVIPGPLRDAHRNGLQRHLQSGETTILDRRVELTGLRADGSEFPIELAVARLPETDPPMFVGFVRDLRERDAAPRENARFQQRMTFLAQAGLVLDRSLDYDETLDRLADLTVPDLAQLTVIDLVDDDGLVRTAVAAADEPGRACAVEDMRRAHPLAREGAHPVAEVLRTGSPVLLRTMTPEFQQTIAEGGEHYALMRRLRYRSAIVVPLIARQRVLGTLSLLRMDGAASFGQDELVLAEELARRAALSIDNARLFEATRHLARTLQQSLLPRCLPDIPGVRLAGRYRAAAEGQEVGGDFYDAFQIADDRWGVAVGDVCGKGPEAAALTALARWTLRACADRDPANALGLLNQAVMRDHRASPHRFLTCVFGHVSRLATDRVELEIAVGGHPPPLVLRAGGTVERVSARGPLIGVVSGVEHRAQRVVLRSGDTVLLYTDGLTDAQAPARMLSEPDLAELLARTRGLDPDEISERLAEAAAAGAQPRDDIALLVMQVDSASPVRTGFI
jgi:PAS domain S-box-containing protein